MSQDNTNSSFSTSTRSFYIENLGCSKNQVDAEIMVSALLDRGWKFYRHEPEKASFIIINTCGFIESAKKEAVETIMGTLQQYPGKKVIAAGCMAQRYGKELRDQIPELTAVFGNKIPEQVPDFLENIPGDRLLKPVGNSSFPLRKDLFSFKGSAYVKIAEGCNNNCRFCAIPLIRGPVVSRPSEEIINELKDLLSKGIFEFNLVTQDLANWGEEWGDNLAVLLKEISKLEGDFWIRLLYIHPDHFPFEILPLMKEDPRIIPYFDIPFQHASEKVLRGMGRRGNSKIYLELIEKIRAELPHCTIRSTFMTGFPGEDKSAFNELLDFQEKAELDWLGVFSFSPEEDTPAYKESHTFSARRTRAKGEKRKNILEEKQVPLSEKRLSRWIEQEVTLLVEEEIPEEDLFLSRSVGQAPEIDGLTVLHGENLKTGDHIRARIIKANGFDLEAVALEEGEA
ncbi:MAG: 30S ribosomal protein S12 methylthiotransferase RimO [Spirochaetales bacterium]|nr:30S ribosomal protein S12 methylthiotransferase RimO [Spirochaetales bacterium]